MTTVVMYGKEVDIEIGGIDHKDYPDFCDAYIESATWQHSGEKLNSKEMEDLYSIYEDDINAMAHESFY